jgi:hypothetical protein
MYLLDLELVASTVLHIRIDQVPWLADARKLCASSFMAVGRRAVAGRLVQQARNHHTAKENGKGTTLLTVAADSTRRVED